MVGEILHPKTVKDGDGAARSFWAEAAADGSASAGLADDNGDKSSSLRDCADCSDIPGTLSDFDCSDGVRDGPGVTTFADEDGGTSATGGRFLPSSPWRLYADVSDDEERSDSGSGRDDNLPFPFRCVLFGAAGVVVLRNDGDGS